MEIRTTDEYVLRELENMTNAFHEKNIECEALKIELKELREPVEDIEIDKDSVSAKALTLYVTDKVLYYMSTKSSSSDIEKTIKENLDRYSLDDWESSLTDNELFDEICESVTVKSSWNAGKLVSFNEVRPIYIMQQGQNKYFMREYGGSDNHLDMYRYNLEDDSCSSGHCDESMKETYYVYGRTYVRKYIKYAIDNYRKELDKQNESE